MSKYILKPIKWLVDCLFSKKEVSKKKIQYVKLKVSI